MAKNKREYYVVYCVTNLNNGKKYIGYTQSFERRKSDHIYLSKTKNNRYKYAFHYAMSKYGVDNFEWSIVKTYDSYQAAQRAEKYYIRTWNTLAPNGYNLTTENAGKPGGKKRVPDDTIILIKQEILDGYTSYEEIDKKYGIAFQTVSKIATNRTRGALIGNTPVLNRTGYYKYHPEGIEIPSREELQQLIDSGKTLKDIGRIFGVAGGTVANWADRAGCTRPIRKITYRPSKEELAPLIELYQLKQIAKLYSVTYVTVGKWIRRYGLPGRRQVKRNRANISG